MKYDFSTIEGKWQQQWQSLRTFATANPGDADFDPSLPKYYILDMFPYPSGVGLHVGHPLGYIATDIVARYKRMRGFAVLHPMGYDAFGLPAEQFAVETGVHPAITTDRNIANMTRQLKRLGLSYDWDRTLTTTDPSYYRWTQWIFLQIYNSWYDPVANGVRPIDELVQQLESRRYDIDPYGDLVDVEPTGSLEAVEGVAGLSRKWYELSEPERQGVLNHNRMAYLDEVPVNWCPALGTVLANEEVTNEGRSERGNHPVYKRPMRQWMLRITAYCERLLNDLDLVDWPESIKRMQRDWIGKSRGALVDFALTDSDETIRVFTTRPDTLFGATYMVLAPEHPLVDQITDDAQRIEVEQYQREAEARSDVARMTETGASGAAKTGIDTGASAVNPTNGQRIPIWISDYVLMGYGTGAIMAVPAHDQRDFEFAKQFELPIRVVVVPPDDWLQQHSVQTEAYRRHPEALSEAYAGSGTSIDSSNDDVSLDGLSTEVAKAKITNWLHSKRVGCDQVQYKLRDWLFSRQRYWGEPFPILHGPHGQVVAVDESQLPVELPPMDDFKPQASDDPDVAPQPPLSRAPEKWKYVHIDGVRYERELNTMPQWAGSCWYYLRFCDPQCTDRIAGTETERYWMNQQADDPASPGGVDLYVGGAEHAVLHLLYARFWHKLLYDRGHLSTPEPFGRLFNQGYIQASAYLDVRGIYVPAEEVEQRDSAYYYQGQPVERHYGKMGKSLKNAVAPDEICDKYGCDSLRLYEMYLGPLDQSKPWQTQDIVGVHRFLQRFWRNLVGEDGALTVTEHPPSPPLTKALHLTIKRVSEDMERMTFNTAIAALIELNNQLVAMATVPRLVAEKMTLLLAPMAPHICEELWQRLGHEQSLSREPWPTYDESLLLEDEIEYPVQVNGKLRSRIRVAADADATAVETAARDDPAVRRALGEKSPQKVIVVPGRLINIVAK